MVSEYRSDPRVLDDLRDRLAEQATLFDDPGAYLAGVSDALDAIVELDGEDGTDPPRPAPVAIRTQVDPGDAPTRRSDRARYLAALAVGLATAGRDHREIVDELLDTAEGCATLLQQAARCVYALRIGEATHRRTAEALLLQAVIEARPVPRVPERLRA